MDRRVSGRVDTRDVDELVPRPLVFGILGVDEVGVLDAVVIHHREAVDIGFLGYRAGFSRCYVLSLNSGRGGGQAAAGNCQAIVAIRIIGVSSAAPAFAACPLNLHGFGGKLRPT